MPVSDELLLKLIYQEENQKLLDNARAQLDKMTDSEKELVKQNAALKESSESVEGGFSKLQAGIVTLNAGIGVVKEAVGVFKEAWNFAKESAAIGRIKDQFSNVAASINTDTDKLLAGLDKAAHGTVDDEQLMQTATRAMALGIANNSDDLVRLMEIARASSVAFGGDTASAFDRISNAVENLSPRSLKQSGIVINLTTAYKDYAAQLGKVPEQLTDEEKRQALLNQTLEKGADLVKRIGAQGEDTVTKLARLETKIKDIDDQAKERLLPVMDKVADMFSSWLEVLGPANTEEERLRQLVIQTAYSFGEESEQVKIAAKALQDYLIIQKQVAMTEAERSLRASMSRIGALEPTPTGLQAMEPAKQAEAAKAYTDYQSKLSGIEEKYDTERAKAVEDMTSAINKLETEAGRKRVEIVANFAADEASRLSDMQDKRVSILMDYADNEQKITTQQNADRIKLAQNYGLEAERMEQAHQLSMARLQEDHTRTLRKLADSRDALAIEDEQETYQVNRRRAEEDYQIQAGQRSADYARQLADQNASFEQQRLSRAAERDKQLTELAAQFAKQDDKYKAAYNKQLADLDQQTKDQRQQLWQAEDQKLRDLRIQQDAERAQAITQWTQWRNEHEIFFAGERAQWDAYLKYTSDQLQAYMTSGGITPTTAPIGHPNAPGRAAGGMVSPFGAYTVGEHGPEMLYMGNQGGYVSPMGGLSIGKIDINVAGTNATPEDIMTAVYTGITQVFEKAMRQ